MANDSCKKVIKIMGYSTCEEAEALYFLMGKECSLKV